MCAKSTIVKDDVKYSYELPLFDEYEIIDEPDFEEDIKESLDIDRYQLTVAPKDWTVLTIIDQIKKGNIELDPDFQRRNAWNDKKRCMLIESLILNIPVPEIILAEHEEYKKKFIVIDGKQRLLTLYSFYYPNDVKYWDDKPKLKGLKTKSLNNLTYAEFSDEFKRSLDNADIRCSFIVNYSSKDVLYDIFYRLNNGSAKLSSQELRNALYASNFSKRLLKETEENDFPLRKILNIDKPDKRLVDVEILLRFIAYKEFINEYDGNIRKFLDKTMKFFRDNNDNKVDKYIKEFNEVCCLLIDMFDKPTNVGKRISKDEKWHNKTNKSLLESMLYMVSIVRTKLRDQDIIQNKEKFLLKYKELLINNDEFIDAISHSTKSTERLKTRLNKISEIFNDVYDISIEINKVIYK